MIPGSGGAASGAEILKQVLVRHFPSALECDHGRNMDRIICDCATVDLGWHPTILEAKRSWVAHVFDCLAAADQVAGSDKELLTALDGCVLLTAEEAEKVRTVLVWQQARAKPSSNGGVLGREALALLGGDQYGKRCPVCYSPICPATLQPGKDGGLVCTHGCGYREDGDDE